MDYNYLSSISQSRNRNIKINQNLESRSNEKKIPSNQVASNAVQAYLARKQQEERQKYEEARKRKEQLLALRAQNSKNNKKAKIMASRTKDNDFSKIKLTEDEVEAKIRREQEINRKHLTNTVDRMRARIQLEERDNQLPRTRKKKPIDHQSQILKHNSPVEIEYKFNGNSVPIPVVVNKYKVEEKKKKVGIAKSKSVPVMDYRNLLEIAAKKQYESVPQTEYEDFEEESDEYEDDQAEISEMQTNNLPNYTTEKTEQVQKLNQKLKINKVLDKQKLKQNKENSYDTNNSIKNEISNSDNINCNQVNKSYQKDISNNSIHTKKSKSIANRDSLQKTKYSNNNSLDLINAKQKVLPKLNKYEEYIRKPVDKHNEEEYVPQFKKPEVVSNKHLIQNQKQKELCTFSSHKISTHSKSERELNNKKKTSFQIAVDKMNRSKKISASISSNSIHANGKYQNLRESKENLLKSKTESFKIPKRKNEFVADYDENPPCYYTDDNEERATEKSKSHVKMRQNSEKRAVNSIHKKKENDDRHLLNNNRIYDQMSNKTKHNTVDKYNSNIENKPKEKSSNSATKRTIHKVNELEQQKQYFTVTGEEKSKYVPSSKSLIKNKHIKNSVSSNEVYQYFTEDFKKDDSAFQKKDTIKSIKHNHSDSVHEKYKVKPTMNTHKINHNRSSDIRKSSYELKEIERNESPPVKVLKNENIVRHVNKIQRLEKSTQKMQGKKLSSEYETIANERLKIKDDFKKETGITKEKMGKEFSGKNLNLKIKNENKTDRKIDFNSIHKEKTKYPEYTSVQKKALNEDKNKLDFIQREHAFPKKVLSETKRIIPPSNMAHLMKKEYSQKNNDHSKFSEKLRLENQQKHSFEKPQMVPKNSENSNRTYPTQKVVKSSLNSNSNINKYPEANSNKRKAIPSEKYIQHNNNNLHNIKNPKMKPITSSDYVGIKRDRYGRPLASIFLKKNIDSEDEEEEEEEEYDDDMADFIDDGPLEEDDEDYSRYIREIFGYDKRRYHYEDDFDDQAMESSYAEQMKEERRSARIGLLEDLEDIRKEEEEKQRKAHKKLKIK